MAKKITVHYTVSSWCTKEIDVDDDFEIKGKTAKSVYKELCKRLPEENIEEIEEEESDHEIYNSYFVKLDGIEVFDKKTGKEETYSNKKR